MENAWKVNVGKPTLLWEMQLAIIHSNRLLFVVRSVSKIVLMEITSYDLVESKFKVRNTNKSPSSYHLYFYAMAARGHQLAHFIRKAILVVGLHYLQCGIKIEGA